MSNPHIQAAVGAGAKALNVLAVAQGALDDWDQWATEAEATLTAMLPHLRAMIAEEIMAEAGYPSSGFIRYHSFTKAAEIAKGPQQ